VITGSYTVGIIAGYWSKDWKRQEEKSSTCQDKFRKRNVYLKEKKNI
jgi:hypothetical protein